MKLILLVVALVLAILGAVLAFGWFTSTGETDSADLFGVLFLSLASYFGSLLAPN